MFAAARWDGCAGVFAEKKAPFGLKFAQGLPIESQEHRACFRPVAL
jgi:hypothetical protein